MEMLMGESALPLGGTRAFNSHHLYLDRPRGKPVKRDFTSWYFFRFAKKSM
jgi:hypothetical protein